MGHLKVGQVMKGHLDADSPEEITGFLRKPQRNEIERESREPPYIKQIGYQAYWTETYTPPEERKQLSGRPYKSPESAQMDRLSVL